MNPLEMQAQQYNTPKPRTCGDEPWQEGSWSDINGKTPHMRG